MLETQKLTRRKLLASSLAAGGIATLSSVFLGRLWSTDAQATEGVFEIIKTEDEWRKLLTKDQFYVMRKEGTERAGTSPLNNEKRDGIFQCAACELDLYASKDKYDSKTGWPSFTRPISDDAVATKEDRILFFARTEVHCRRCGGHLGHIFNDGPKPTGKRHCINGVSLKFKPAV